MEPITTAIVAALIASLNDVTKTAVKDTYTALKTKIISLVKDKDNLVEAMEKLESTPDSKGRQLTLDEEFAKVKIGETVEVQALIKQLIDQLNKDQNGKAVLAKFNINAEKVGVVAENVNIVNQQF